MDKKLIYVAGPLTTGNTIQNMRAAVEAGTAILKAGHYAYVPHLSVLWDWMTPMDYEEWMDLDFGIIERCDVLLRLPGECPGCMREAAHAEELDIPVLLGLDRCLEWLSWERHTCPECGQQLVSKPGFDVEAMEYGMIWYSYDPDEVWMVGSGVCPECGGEMA